MSELRWILLAAGIVLLVVLYVRGMRSRERSATRGFDASRRVEPPLPTAPSPTPDTVRREPRLTLDDRPESDDDDVEPGRGREARDDKLPVHHGKFDDLHPTPVPPSSPAGRGTRAEPTLSVLPSEPERSVPAMDASGSGHAPGEARAQPKRPQKIVAVRISAPLPTRFDGAQLREALRTNGLQHGRFDIFHRLAPDGRPIISLASVLEPGTFDPAAMDTAAYPGVALFTVLPGPVSALDALEDLLVTSRALATQLGGTLLDDRGTPLSLQRIAHLRDDVLAFERVSRPADSAG